MTNLRIGETYQGKYPAANFEHVPLRMEVRRFRVDGVIEGPIKEETLKMNPHLRRLGRRLKVWDCDARKAKTFYEGAIVEPLAIEPPAEMMGWQVISLERNGRERISIQSCTEEFANGFCKGLAELKCKADARPFPLPDLRRNLAS